MRTTFTVVFHWQLWVKGSRLQLKLWTLSNLFLQNIQKINVLVIKNINYMHFIRIISRQFCTVYHHMLSDTNAWQQKLKICWVWHIKKQEFPIHRFMFSHSIHYLLDNSHSSFYSVWFNFRIYNIYTPKYNSCLLYTSDAADER